MATPSQGFFVDISELTKLGSKLGQRGQIIVRNELTTAMDRSLVHVQTAANARVHHRSGNYSRSYRRRISVGANGIVGTISNVATSAAGFMYSRSLEWGRRGFSAIRAKALRFVINGEIIFRKSVGPAPAQHILEYGANDAMPRVYGEFDAAQTRVAARIETLR